VIGYPYPQIQANAVHVDAEMAKQHMQSDHRNRWRKFEHKEQDLGRLNVHTSTHALATAQTEPFSVVRTERSRALLTFPHL
jgi:hypothetical protein